MLLTFAVALLLFIKSIYSPSGFDFIDCILILVNLPGISGIYLNLMMAVLVIFVTGK